MKRIVLLTCLLMFSLAGSRPTQAQDPVTCRATDPGVTFTPDPCSWDDADAYTGWVSACHGAGKDPDAVYPTNTECYSPLDNCRIRMTCPGTQQNQPPMLYPITNQNAANITQIGGWTSDRKFKNFDFADDKMLFTYQDNVYIFSSPVFNLPQIEPQLVAAAFNQSLHTPTLLDRLLQVEPSPIVLHHDGLSGAMFDPVGTLVATSSLDGSVRVWDANTGDNLFDTQAHLDNVWSMAFSADGNLLATAGNSTPDDESPVPDQVAVWDVTTGNQLLVMDVQSQVYSLAFSPDGSTLATGSGVSNVELWDVASGDNVTSLPHAPQTVNSSVESIAFSPDGSQLLAASYEFAKVYAVAQWQEAYTVPDSRATRYVEYGVDGSVIFTGGFDNVRVSDAETGEELNTLLRLHQQQVLLNMNLSHDGTLLTTVVAELDNEAQQMINIQVAFWGVTTGVPVPAEVDTPAPGDTTTDATDTCTVSASANVNLRAGPGTNYAIAGTLTAGSTEIGDGQTTGADGFVWWHLERDAWVRSDIVNATEPCATVPETQP